MQTATFMDCPNHPLVCCYSSDQYCPVCGEKLVERQPCQGCGNVPIYGDRFCRHCGIQLNPPTQGK